MPGFGPIESLLYLGTVTICFNEAEFILIMMSVFVQFRVNITILDGDILWQKLRVRHVYVLGGHLPLPATRFIRLGNW